MVRINIGRNTYEISGMAFTVSTVIIDAEEGNVSLVTVLSYTGRWTVNAAGEETGDMPVGVYKIQ